MVKGMRKVKVKRLNWNLDLKKLIPIRKVREKRTATSKQKARPLMDLLTGKGMPTLNWTD